MKNKPLAHKDENTFKFQTFSERISNINIDVIHRIGRTTLVPDDTETFFLETLQKWNDLNYTEDFDALVKEIGHDIQSLPQLVHRQDEIVQILLRNLSNPDSLALDASFELLVALARDLQIDFYPYFPQFFEILVQLLAKNDAKILEQVFTTLAYLFKFLWRYMLKDIDDIFGLYSPLFNHKKEHIRNFAAESFAFLMRKAPDKELLFKMVFQNLEENPQRVLGIGQLLFHMMKGVKKQFHSCTEHSLTVLLDLIWSNTDVNIESNLKVSALLQTALSMCIHAGKEYTGVIWKVFYTSLNSLREKRKVDINSTDNIDNHIAAVLTILNQFVAFKDAILILKPAQIITALVPIFSLPNLNDCCGQIILEVGSSLLCSKNIEIESETSDSFINSVFESSLSSALFFNFAEQLFDYKRFEEAVLPKLLNYCNKCLSNNLVNEVLTVIASLIVHKNGPLSVDKQPEENQLDFKLDESNNLFNLYKKKLRGAPKDVEGPSFKSEICKILKVVSETSNLPAVWASLVASPYLSFTDNIGELEDVALKLQNILVSNDSHVFPEWESCAYVLAQTISAIGQLDSEALSKNSFNYKFFFDILKLNSTSSSILYLFNVYRNVSPRLNQTEFDEVLQILLPNLASPYHKTRLLTLRILSSYDLQLPVIEDEDALTNRMNVFEICLAAEEIPLTIQDSRKKLVLLQKLEYNQVRNHLPIGSYELVPVYYLIGNLYVNFQLLWKPIQQYLESQSRGLGKSFWTVFLPHLKVAADNCESVLQGMDLKPNITLLNDDSPLGELFNEQLGILCAHEDVPDFSNHRLLLWQAMANFADLAERRNREIVSMYLTFLDNEYFLMDSTICKTEDISKSRKVIRFAIEGKKQKRVKKRRGHFRVQRKPKTPKQNSNSNDNQKHQHQHKTPDLEESSTIINSQNDDATQTVEKELAVDESTIESVLDDAVDAPRRKATSKTLAAHLSVFAKFKNPKAIFREPEMYKLHLELLAHKDESIQKLAFGCLMTYNHEFLTPYKTNFHNLLDDKTFKTEIVLFSIDSEHGVIDKSHRAELLPILMRILYGKMLRKTGSNTSGKSNAQFRRSIVLRFLAGCQENELNLFLQFVFAPFVRYFDADNVFEMVQTIRRDTNPSVVIPIRRQLSILNTLGTVFGQLGSLIKSLLPWLLKVLLSLLTTASALLDKREELHPMFLNPLKTLRTQAVYKLIQFFQMFDHYAYTKEEIDAIFEAAVWPMLPRLETESLVTPSPLLKLLTSWSENPRFYVLLGKYHPKNSTLCPVESLTKLYISDKVQHGVVVVVSNMLENLLTTKDYDPDEADEDHELGPVLDINEAAKVTQMEVDSNQEPPNYGTLLLIPYVSRILQRLQLLVERTVKNPKKLLSSMELGILSRISEYLRDPEQSSTLVSLLLPFLTKTSRRNEEVEISTLTSIRNLVQWAKNPWQFLKPLAPLFSILTHRVSRTGLCAILSSISERDETKKALATTILKLNAWHPKMMDEPDYNTRLDAFKFISECLNGPQDIDIDVEFIMIVIYNCTYYIRTTEDSSLRDNSTHILQQVCQKLASLLNKDIELFRFLTFETLLTEIQKGLRNSAETVRHEFISVFASLLRSCGEHPRLSGLAKLCNVDKDVDFWENIRHIQMHRRARALRRLATEIKDGVVTFPPYIFTSYLLPLTTSFLTNPDYMKHSNLIDAAIELFGAVCFCLPWNRYETTLKYYLGQITKNNEFHKTNIKIVVAILDNFHFDLSKSKGLACNLKEPPKAKAKIVKEVEDNVNDGIEENVDDVEDLNDTGIAENVEDDEEAKKDELDIEKATKIHVMVARTILPKLHSCLNQKARTDDEHKLAKKNYAEDDEILRVPIALAMVKLLQNLPKGMLEQNLPGVFLRIVQFLRSRADSIRDAARDTLLKMMSSLGPAFLWFLLKEMRGVMKRGYQVHVMMYTVHSVLSSLTSRLQPGDLDSCVDSLTELSIQELFGEVAEEKEVDKIAGKLKEARSSKSYSTFQILAEYISAVKLPKLVQPLKDVLSNTHSHKNVRKVQECLRHVVLGLADNKSLTPKDYLIFSHSLTSTATTEMENKTQKPIVPIEKPYVRPDIYLIPDEPKRGGVIAKTSVKTNAHVFLEFGLQLLHFCLKRETVSSTSQEHLEMLDPFIPVLKEALSSLHVKVISTSLRCLAWLVKFPLPCLETMIEPITNGCFLLLNKYCGAGMGQGDNFEMVVMCFKLLTVIVRDVDYHKITDEQLKVLLVYIDQDIHDNSRQATAFTLLKAILSRRLNVDELSAIAVKVQELSVVSEQEHIRTQCRQVFLQYLLEYPHNKGKFERFISFYIVQLEYENESGRESAIEMINSMISNFPEKLLNKYSGMIMIPMAARLVNEESSKSRKIIAATLRNLITKVSDQRKTKLFAVIISWLQSDKMSHQRLGVQLCGLFVEVDKECFIERLKVILPFYSKILNPEQYNEIVIESGEKMADHLVYHALNSFMKILNICGYENVKLVDSKSMFALWQYAEKHLLHAHNWVRLVSAQLFGLLFSNYKVEELVESVEKNGQSTDFLLCDTRQRLRDLSSDFCAQLNSEEINDVHGEQIVRNLVYLGKVIRRLPVKENDDVEEDGIKVSLNWMMQRLRHAAKMEVLNPKSVTKRMCVFKWFAAISLDMNKEEVEEKLTFYLPLLCRELSDQSIHLVELRKLAQEVCDLLKGIVGIETFSRALVSAQGTLSAKKYKRKVEKATEAVNNPEISARKKMKSHESKQQQKKRKFESFKNNPKKRKTTKFSEIAMSST